MRLQRVRVRRKDGKGGGATLSDQGYFKGETGVATGVNGSLDGWTVLR